MVSSQKNYVALERYRDLLTVQDLTEILGVSKQTAYKELRNGKFGKPIKFGREYRIPKIFLIVAKCIESEPKACYTLTGRGCYGIG